MSVRRSLIRLPLTVAATLSAIFSIASAQAASSSQLTSVAVTPIHGGARITLQLPLGVPSGWTVTGSGTTELAVTLPNVTAATSISPAPYKGVNTVSSVTVAATPTELDVGIHLTAPVSVRSGATATSIVVDVGATPTAKAVATAGNQARPALPAMPTPAQIGGRVYEVIPLKYADVSEVVGILVDNQQVAPNDVFQPQGSIFSLPTSAGVPQAQPVYNPNTQQPQSFGQKVSDNIAYDRRLNAIILSGTPDEIASYKAIIEKIDVPLPSVMLECAVVELSQTAAHDLGLDLTSGVSGSPIVSASGSVGNVTSTNPDTHAYRAQFQAQLFATIAHGGGKILATPRVLALNGTPAQILTGDALPIITTTVQPGTPPLLTQTVNYIAVGVNLQIQPRITTDNYVTSHIFAEVSSVTAFVSTQQGFVPQISLRQAATNATVADGEAFVVGGLLKDEEIETMSKIPVLGDLPIIGGLFRVRHDSNTKTNLYIIITPHIVNQHAESQTLT
ncbi:MAG: hypothetical protein JO165_05645, partial [Candidatus Eremiobacteraeota bacterium]|nr:hypothetical protein [Candidatus Eremiobacteraeota bacterium]